MNDELTLNPADYLTLANVVLGFLAITYVIDGRYWTASFLIIICVLLDGLDGLVARRLDVAHRLGAYLDTFSDTISFCFTPALLLYSTYYYPDLGRAWESPVNALATLVPTFIVFFGILRLARFTDEGIELGYYRGLPTPALALTVVITSTLIPLDGSNMVRVIVLLSIILGLSLLLYTKIPYPKIRSTKMLISGLLVSILAMIGLISTRIGYLWNRLFMTTALLLITAYIIFGPFMVDRDG